MYVVGVAAGLRGTQTTVGSTAPGVEIAPFLTLEPAPPAFGRGRPVRVALTDSDGVSWPGSDEVVPEERYHALRMLNGVGEG